MPCRRTSQFDAANQGDGSGLHRALGTPTSSRGGGESQLQAYTVEQVAEMLHVGRDKVYYAPSGTSPGRSGPSGAVRLT